MGKLQRSLFAEVFLQCAIICIVGLQLNGARRPSVLHGILDINGQRFTNSNVFQKWQYQTLQATCDCRPPDVPPLIAAQPICSPRQVVIRQDHGSTGLTAEEVRRAFGQPQDVQLVDVGSQPLSCTDDRISSAVLMTLGGDFGEFVLALAVFAEDLQHSNATLFLDERKVRDLLEKYIAQVRPKERKFVMCTDEQVLLRLEKQLQTVGLELEEAPAKLQNKLLDLLTAPENQGDMHLRAILTAPEDYKISSQLVIAALRAYFSTLWDLSFPDRQSLALDIFPGKRNPTVFIEINEGDACIARGESIPVVPRKKSVTGVSSEINALVIHLGAARSRRKELAKFFVGELATMTSSHRGEKSTAIATYLERIEKRANHWLAQTVLVTAKDLRYYRLLFV